MTQGQGIAPSAYVPLMQYIQNASQLELWVGIPAFPSDTPEPLVLDKTYQRILQELYNAGMPQTAELYYAGHSLGGAMVQLWAAENPDSMRGQILFGAFLTREWKEDYVFGYPVSTLTIGGELDGLTRITRISEAYHVQITMSTDPDTAAEEFPVTILEGVTHMQFASGQPPQLVLNRDLLPEVSYPQAWTLISTNAAAYMDSRSLHDQSSADVLSQQVAFTLSFLTPIINSLLYEGYHNFLPPCDCEPDLCPLPPDPSCIPGCPWSSDVSQASMSSGQPGLTITNQDGFHPVYQTDPVHLAEVYNSCDEPDGCVLNTSTVTQALYHTGEEVDIWKYRVDVPEADSSYAPITSRELRTKMTAKARSWTKAGVPDVNFTETDEQNTNCQAINQLSYQYALDHIGSTTLQRYKQYGQPYTFGLDRVVCPAGPCWIWQELEFNVAEDQSYVEVIAPSFPSKALGYHYCKVLSPARSVEWMYIDGLRAFYSLSSNSTIATKYHETMRTSKSFSH